MAYKWGVAVASSLMTAMISPSIGQPLGMVYIYICVAKKTLANTNSLIFKHRSCLDPQYPTRKKPLQLSQINKFFQHLFENAHLSIYEAINSRQDDVRTAPPPNRDAPGSPM